MYWGHVRVHIFVRPISDELAEYLGIQIEYTPLAVVRLVKIYNCFAYDWTQSEMNERLHDMTPKQDVVRH